jgi:hypothetical protein
MAYMHFSLLFAFGVWKKNLMIFFVMHQGVVPTLLSALRKKFSRLAKFIAPLGLQPAS